MKRGGLAMLMRGFVGACLALVLGLSFSAAADQQALLISAPPFNGTFSGNITATSFTATAASGANAFIASTGALYCLDGAGCTQTISYSSANAAIQTSNIDFRARAFGTRDVAAGALTVGFTMSAGDKLVFNGLAGGDTLTDVSGNLQLAAGRYFQANESSGNTALVINAGAIFSINGTGATDTISDSSGSAVVTVAAGKNFNATDGTAAHLVELLPQATPELTFGASGQVCFDGTACADKYTDSSGSSIVTVAGSKVFRVTDGTSADQVTITPGDAGANITSPMYQATLVDGGAMFAGANFNVNSYGNLTADAGIFTNGGAASNVITLLPGTSPTIQLGGSTFTVSADGTNLINTTGTKFKWQLSPTTLIMTLDPNTAGGLLTTGSGLTYGIAIGGSNTEPVVQVTGAGTGDAGIQIQPYVAGTATTELDVAYAGVTATPIIKANGGIIVGSGATSLTNVCVAAKGGCSMANPATSCTVACTGCTASSICFLSVQANSAGNDATGTQAQCAAGTVTITAQGTPASGTETFNVWCAN